MKWSEIVDQLLNNRSRREPGLVLQLAVTEATYEVKIGLTQLMIVLHGERSFSKRQSSFLRFISCVKSSINTLLHRSLAIGLTSNKSTCMYEYPTIYTRSLRKLIISQTSPCLGKSFSAFKTFRGNRYCLNAPSSSGLVSIYYVDRLRILCERKFIFEFEKVLLKCAKWSVTADVTPSIEHENPPSKVQTGQRAKSFH